MGGSAVAILNQPGVHFVDADGNALSADDGTTIASHEGIVICGKDGTVMRFMRVASDGTLRIDPTGTTTQPISDGGGSLTVDGPLTDAELRAVSVPVSGPLTDTELRATVVPVGDGGGSLTVDGPLTDTELRASAVPVSAASLPLPAGAATEATLASLDGKDFATQTTLATLATETKLEAVRVLLASLDGKDYATETTQATLATETKLEAVRVLLASLDGKDYATQTTLAAILVDTGQMEVLLTAIAANTGNLAAVDYATQTTLAAVLVDTGQIEAILTAIRDTAGIKKITDQLPAGTNEIGKVAQGTKAAGADAWPVALYDVSGNPVAVVLNNSIYRLEGRSSITSPDGASDVSVFADNGINHLAAGKQNKVDANNSSTGQLAIDGVFTGTASDVSQFSSIAITIHSDQDSALDGMVFEFSENGTNWDDQYKFNMKVSESLTRRFQFPVTASYFRFRYVNNDTDATTAFRVQTILHRENLLTSIHRIEQPTHEDRSAELVKAAIIAQREGALNQDFYPVKADVAGNLKVTTIGADIPSDPAAFVLEFLRASGGSEDMLVDGSVTPVEFTLGPTIPDETWSLKEVLITFTASDFSFDGSSFGPLTALTNGITFDIVKDGVATPLLHILQNEDFIRVPGRLPLVNNTGPKDILGAVVVFDGLVMNEGTSDYVRMTVNDNLVSVKLNYLTATAFAVRVL